MFNATNSKSIISKPKIFSWFFFFFWISGIYINFWKLSKKSWASHVISYWNYRLEKVELLKSPKTRIRILMDSQHVKGSETLLKTARQYFCDIFWSLSRKISSINAFFEVSQVLRLFRCILTPDNMYILSVKASV